MLACFQASSEVLPSIAGGVEVWNTDRMETGGNPVPFRIISSPTEHDQSGWMHRNHLPHPRRIDRTYGHHQRRLVQGIRRINHALLNPPPRLLSGHVHRLRRAAPVSGSSTRHLSLSVFSLAQIQKASSGGHHSFHSVFSIALQRGLFCVAEITEASSLPP